MRCKRNERIDIVVTERGWTLSNGWDRGYEDLHVEREGRPFAVDRLTGLVLLRAGRRTVYLADPADPLTVALPGEAPVRVPWEMVPAEGVSTMDGWRSLARDARAYHKDMKARR